MKIYLIAPRTDEPNFDSAMSSVPGMRGRYTLVAASGIASVAAWFPASDDIRLCDETVQDVDLEAEADVVGLSINVSQIRRGLELAREFRRRGRRVVLGGAHVSLAPELFRGEADCLVIGEFETVAPRFMEDLQAGRLQSEYRCGQADLAEAPVPRWDLYPNDGAVTGVVQTSRGCPFECSFCDVIQYLGRKQRHKPPHRVIAELEVLHALGYREITLSDDNFTVYRKRTRELLTALLDWNGAEGRAPVQFSTQMSIDVARDPDLLALCNAAGLRHAFVGLETSNAEALTESRKRQNLGVDLVGECEKIVRAGLTIHAGLIVGFDHDDLSCFEQQFAFAQRLPVVGLNVSALVAPYATPLYAEMRQAGRIVEEATHGTAVGNTPLTNLIPARMTREELAEGRAWLKTELLAPENAILRFERYAKTLGAPRLDMARSADQSLRGRRHPLRELIPMMAREPGMRRLITGVRDTIAERPEIAYDLNSTLAMYLADAARTRAASEEHALRSAS